MGRRVSTYDYLPRSIKNKDTDGEMLKVMQAIDVALDDVADETLVTSWDIEGASREELNNMADSIGIFVENFMSDDVVRRYIRTSGKIRELKGTDAIIEQLVDSLTRFKVQSVELNDVNNLKVNVKLSYGSKIDFLYEQRLLDFFVEKYKKLLYTYDVTYTMMYEVYWINTMNVVKSTTKEVDKLVLLNFERYTYPQPFQYQPFDDLTGDTPLWTIFTNDVMRSATNTTMDVTTEVTPTTKLKNSITVDPQPSVSVTTKLRKEFQAELVPSLTDEGTTKVMHTVDNKSTRTSDMFYAIFKTPFELVTMY